jgi:hypothetical protein
MKTGRILSRPQEAPQPKQKSGGGRTPSSLVGADPFSRSKHITVVLWLVQAFADIRRRSSPASVLVLIPHLVQQVSKLLCTSSLNRQVLKSTMSDIKPVAAEEGLRDADLFGEKPVEVSHIRELTDEEKAIEKKLVRRIDWIILPIILAV